MRKVHVLAVAIVSTVMILTGCGKKATEEECMEFAMELDFKALEKGKCDEHLEM